MYIEWPNGQITQPGRFMLYETLKLAEEVGATILYIDLEMPLDRKFAEQMGILYE